MISMTCQLAYFEIALAYDGLFRPTFDDCVISYCIRVAAGGVLLRPFDAKSSAQCSNVLNAQRTQRIMISPMAL